MIHHSLIVHWGRVTHICISKLTIIGLDNGLSPSRRQAIAWTNARLLLTGPLGTNFSEILIKINIFLIQKMRSKMLSWKWRPFCLGLNVLSEAPPAPVQDISLHPRHSRARYTVLNKTCTDFYSVSFCGDDTNSSWHVIYLPIFLLIQPQSHAYFRIYCIRNSAFASC